MPPSPVARSWRSPVRLGVAGAVLLFVCLAGVPAATYRAFLSADEPHHVDYAWRVWHGELPSSDDPVTAPIGTAEPPPVHFTWQHPPAFYLVEAPIVGPLLDAGRWRAAVFAGRLLPLAFGAATVLAVALATRRIGDRPEPALVVGAAAVAAVSNPLLGTSSAVYNDSMATFASTVALGTAVHLVRRGPSARAFALLAGACTVGFATRATFVTTLLVCSAAALWVGVRGPLGAMRSRARAVAAAASVLLVPLLATAWVWARNRDQVGSWTGGQRDVAVEYLGRTLRTPWEVLTTFDIWRFSLGGLFPQPGDPADPARWPFDLAIRFVIAVALLAAARAIAVLVRGGREGWRRHLPVALVLGGAVAGVLAQQAQHATNGGAPNARYLLPALLPIALAAAWGLLWPRRARGALLLGFVVLAIGAFLVQIREVVQRRMAPDLGWWDGVREAVEGNGLPVALLGLAVAGGLAGLAAVGWSLWHLTAADAEH